MILREKNEKVEAVHGTVAAFPREFFGYFGWPTLTRMADGTLLAAASGLRNAHVCPFGRNVICSSHDDGASWTSPRVINDSPLDDRDTGVIEIGEGTFLLSWFSTDNRDMLEKAPAADRARWLQGLAGVTDEKAARGVGSWICTSADQGENWTAPVRVPVNAPHGPIRLSSGELLYLGKDFTPGSEGVFGDSGAIFAARSTDFGTTWEQLGEVPLIPGTAEANYHEAHVVELADGRLLGLVRLENSAGLPKLETHQLIDFSMVQSMSDDRGRTWTEAEPLNFHGCPPHLMLHSSDTLVCVYGFRQEPYGERAMISRDGGESWDCHYIIRDDAPDGDLGYPSSVELADESLLTLYYQKPESREDKCALLWSRWKLPA